MEFEGVKIYKCKSRRAKVVGLKFWCKSPIPGFCEDFEEATAISHGRAFKTLRMMGEYILTNQKIEADNKHWKRTRK